MVQKASEAESKAWAALPSRTEMGFRRVSSVFLMGCLLTILTPFTPFRWVFPTDGPELLDGFISPVLILGSLFFQWRIAGVIAPFTIDFLDNVFIYKHDMYWPLAFCEVVLAAAVFYNQNEVLRRFAAVGSVAILWAIGWFCTPQRYKQEAWQHLKWIWTWMAFNEATRAMHGGYAGGRGNRRRW